MARIPTLVHNEHTLTPYNTSDDIAATVVGHGSWLVNGGGTLAFLYGVSSGQTIELSGVVGKSGLIIDDPADFHAHIDMTYVTPPGKAPPGWEQLSIGIPMVGHAVDSWSFNHDMLKLWLGNKVVEAISLTVHDPYGITVQAAPGGWIFASANTPTQRGLEFLGSTQPYPAMKEHV